MLMNMGDDLKTFLLNINSLHFQLERKFREVSKMVVDVEIKREQCVGGNKWSKSKLTPLLITPKTVFLSCVRS